MAPRLQARVVAALALGLVGAIPVAARARTSPISGAVAAPAQLALRAPFPCGTAYRVTCGYGPGCSSFHSGTSDTRSSNDYYALDLVRASANSGRDEPVNAVAAGVVRYAGWSTGGWASYGQIVFVEHDIGDGHRYASLYAHLQRVAVQRGQRVAAGDALGTMGGSAFGGYDGYATHLHFAMYRDAQLDGGPYGGQALVPEPLGGAANLVRGLSLSAACDADPPADPPPPAEPGPGPLAPPDLGLAPDAGGMPFTEDEQGIAPGRRGAAPPVAYGGCAATPGGGSRAGWPGALLALAVLAARRRRQRVSTR